MTGVVRREDSVAVTVWGFGGCFTRPEMKAERVSYPVITFPAAVGVLDAIFRKPEFCWQIDAVAVLRQGYLSSLMRNEVKVVAGKDGEPINVVEERDQRGMLYLRDVCYTIIAHPVVKDQFRSTNSPKKYQAMFDRRVSRGQCMLQPFLGTREFSAFFAPEDDVVSPVAWTQNLGVMHSGFDYRTQTPTPQFDTFEIVNGVLGRSNGLSV